VVLIIKGSHSVSGCGLFFGAPCTGADAAVEVRYTLGGEEY